MIAQIQLTYGFRDDKPTPEQVEALRPFLPDIKVGPVKLKEDGTPAYDSEYTTGTTGYVNIEAFMKACPWAKFSVTEVCPSTADGILPAVERLNARIDQLVDSQLFNERCNVHVGGSTLMAVNKVIACTDCCTDMLQGYLDEGWRIIACCVQPDGRRPDYVMGRSQ
jgi:hypothetical protein